MLCPDTFVDGAGVSIYGSVLRDGGMLRMWYHAIPRDWDYQADMSSIAYAESDDGIHWRKPALGILPHGAEPNNLTNLGLHSATVFIDPNSPPSHRYRATGCGYKGLFLVHPEIEQSGYYTAHSADGLVWTLDAPVPRWRSADVITSVYHPGRQAGVTALKYSPRWMRMGRRSIHTAEFRDGVYSDAVSALYADEFDDLIAATRGFHSCDYYGMGMLPAGQGLVGFLWNYWHELPYTGNPTLRVRAVWHLGLHPRLPAGSRWALVPPAGPAHLRGPHRCALGAQRVDQLGIERGRGGRRAPALLFRHTHLPWLRLDAGLERDAQMGRLHEAACTFRHHLCELAEMAALRL